MGALELGNVGAHFYLEIETGGMDESRLQTAWQRLIERHGMLRTVVSGDGRQRTLEHVPPYRIQVLELPQDRGDEAERAMAQVREEKCRSNCLLPINGRCSISESRGWDRASVCTSVWIC